MFEAELKEGERADVLYLRGDMAFDTLKGIQRVVEKLISRGRQPLVIEMSKVEFVDSKGAAQILQLKYTLSMKKVAMACLQWKVRNVLERLHILDNYKVFKSEEEAVRLVHDIR